MPIIITKITDRDRELADYWVGQPSPNGLKGWLQMVVASCREEGRRTGLINAANVAESTGWQVGEGGAQAIGAKIRSLLDDEPL